MRIRIALVFVLCSLANISYGDSIHWKEVNGWEISFFPEQRACMAYLPYEGGTDTWIGISHKTEDFELEIMLADESWKAIEKGKEYDIIFRLGNATPWTLPMTGGRTKSGRGTLFFSQSYELKSSKEFLSEFQSKLNMKVHFGERELGFYSLRGTRAAIDEVYSCAVTYAKKQKVPSDPFAPENSSVGSDPFAL